MNSLKKIACKVLTFVKPDWMFAFMATTFIALSIKQSIDAQSNDNLPAILLVSVLLSSAFAAISSRIDRRLIEDYFYQIIAHAAIVGIISTIFVVGGFDIFDDRLPALEAKDVLFVILGGWSFGYFYYRWRGFNS